MRDLLRRSVDAERSLSYQGNKNLSRRVRQKLYTTNAQVFHSAPDRTLMVGLTGELADARLLQLGRQHFLKPPRGEYRRTPLPLPLDNTELLLRNYRIRQMRVEPIAGRKTIMAALLPRRPGNPHKLVWLDVKTALPLKTQIRNHKGELTEESQFLTIQYNARFSGSEFTLPATARRDEWPEVNPDFNVLRPRANGIPPGYRLVETSVRRLPGGHVVAFQRLSDGLNTLTVVQSRTHPRLAAVAGSAATRGKVGEVQFVIFGEHDPVVLQRLANNLR